MKIAICGDVHWSRTSSIVRGNRKKYSTRLENLIKSVSWFEQIAQDSGCQNIVYLGDFFDRSDLNAEEITALSEVEWSFLPHYFIVGNHESNSANLVFNSANLFNLIPSSYAYVLGSLGNFDWDRQCLFIPYITEVDRKSLKDYITSKDKPIVFSHNDIKGIRYGQVESKEGFDLKEIEENCSLFINGHIHNGSYLNKNRTILNLGNLTGQNFSEDAFNYKHCIAILDTNTLNLDFIENPYALNFYKIDLDKDNINIINTLHNAVLTIKCKESQVKEVRDIISNNPNIVESRIISTPDIKDNVEISELASLDHIEQFRTYIIEKLGNTDIVVNELMEISK